MIRSNKLLRAARGQDCTLGILGVCNYDSSTVVACHLPDDSHGMGLKSHDICIVFGCSSCHDVMDGRRRWPEFELNREWYMRRALQRTLVKLMEMSVLRVA